VAPQIAQALPDIEVAAVVDGRFSPQGLALLVVSLDAGPFVVDVQGWDYAVGDHTGAEFPGSGFGHSSIEYQLYLFGPADVQVFPSDILEEDPPTDGAI
jgi:hypothetical protein